MVPIFNSRQKFVLNFIDIQLIYNVVLISAVQQSDSVIHVYSLSYYFPLWSDINVFKMPFERFTLQIPMLLLPTETTVGGGRTEQFSKFSFETERKKSEGEN